MNVVSIRMQNLCPCGIPNQWRLRIVGGGGGRVAVGWMHVRGRRIGIGVVFGIGPLLVGLEFELHTLQYSGKT